MLPDESEYVKESSGVLAIPSCLSNRDVSLGVQRSPKEGHQTVEAKEQRSRALDGLICPLALRLDAQMGTSLLKRHFQTPALHEVAHDLFYRLGGIGGKDGFGRTLALGITREHPTNRQRIGSIAIPQCCSRADLQGSLPFAVPI